MIDYEFYLNTYFGKIIPKEEWLKFSQLAKNKVDFLTYGRASKLAEPLPQEVNFCICELAEYLYSNQANGSNIASESTDGHSVNYQTKTKQELEFDMRQIALEHLANTGLMYPGVAC